MKIHIETDVPIQDDRVRPGNVYPVRGGRGLKHGHLNIVLCVTEAVDAYSSPMALCLTVRKDGSPVGATAYGAHYFDDKVPVAFCEGVEAIELVVRSL